MSMTNRTLWVLAPLALATFAVLVVPGCPDEPHEKTCDPACGELQQCVDGVCRDVTCDPRCVHGRVCVNGYCLRPCDPEGEDVCAVEETCCPELRACVDTNTDFFNCGACGQACPTARSNYCGDARCGCLGYSVNPCGEGFGCCDDGCKDLLTDAANCGACGHDCGTLQCVDGQCRCSTDEPCPEGEECCEDGCRDLQDDRRNCGRCGYSCDDGQDCCGGECVNTLAEPAHCGQCGRACADGEECCIGVCADTRADPLNCGECLNECGMGEDCSGGSCE